MSEDDPRPLLRQLNLDQLLTLAKETPIKKSHMERMTKRDLIDFLSHIIYSKQINEILSKHGRTGLYGVIDGHNFEKSALKYFDKLGFKCRLNDIEDPHNEFDIIGEKKTFWSDSYIIAECKNRPRVSMRDFEKFFRKYNNFMKRKGETQEYCTGYLVTSGIFDSQVIKEARLHGIKTKILR
jgi:hypothetical protein